MDGDIQITTSNGDPHEHMQAVVQAIYNFVGGANTTELQDQWGRVVADDNITESFRKFADSVGSSRIAELQVG